MTVFRRESIRFLEMLQPDDDLQYDDDRKAQRMRLVETELRTGNGVTSSEEVYITTEEIMRAIQKLKGIMAPKGSKQERRGT